jgi:microcin C transport system substrate-binding protein
VIGEMSIFSEKWLNNKAFNKTLLDKPITSGPFLIESFQPGKTISYIKNPNYWGKDLNVRKGMFNFERIKYKYFKDLTVALEGFKAGSFDFILENNSKRWARDYVGPNFSNGKIKKESLKHSNNAGMQGFIINSRKEKFKNPLTREALALAFDFEWSNKNLFYNQYTRCDSFFSNSEMAAKGKPTGLELSYLEKYKGSMPEGVFSEPPIPASTLRPNSLRKNLRKATQLLKKAGWKIKNGFLVNTKGAPLKFDVLLAQKGFERILAPFVGNLKKLGIQANYRTIDTSLYQKKIEAYDFDMVVMSYGQSQSPGNELKNYFSSDAAKKNGSLILAGVSDKVVDSLIDDIIYAGDREHLVAASKALDRVLLAGHYLIPNWYINKHRVAYKNTLARPETLPLYFSVTSYMLKTWWLKK